MKLTKEKQKEIAIARLEQLKIYKPYITAFKRYDTVTMFENFGGYWATADNGFPELEDKIKKFEVEHGCLVYAVTHEFTDFGELYDFLIISTYSEEEPLELDYGQGTYYPFAWVWNKTNEDYSEYGTIGIQIMGGGIRRIC